MTDPDKSDAAGPESKDPLWRMRAYRLACELIKDSWQDAERLKHHTAPEKVGGQLYTAVGSIGANPAEGYSHSSGGDRPRIFEYALGSAREALVWFRAAEPVLGTELLKQRLDKLQEIRRLL